MTSMEASIGIQPDSLWFYLLKLIRLRWVIFVSGFKRAKPLRKFFTVFLGLLIIGVFVGSFVLTAFLLRLLNSPLISESGVDLASLVDAIPVLIVSGAFLAIFLTSFGVLLQALYLANDMDFLLAAPIPIRAIFLSKLLQAVLPTFLLVMLFGLPVLFGLGVAGGYHILFFPLVLVVLAFLSLAAAGISSLLVMAVVRILPAKRVAEILAFLGAVLAMLCSQVGNLTGMNSGMVSPEQILKSTQVISTLNSNWSPLTWGGRGLVDLGEGRWLSGIFFLALTLVLSGGVFWLTLNAAERLYYTGWASIQVGTQRKKTLRKVEPGEKRGARADIFLRLLPSEVRAIMFKDFLELRRDLRNMSQLVTPLIMGIVFSIMMLRSGGQPPAGRGEAPIWFMDLFRFALAYGSMVISLFVGWTLLSRLALISFSMEGKSYWIIKASPVSAGKQLVAKFLIAYLPALILSWLFLLAVAILQKAPSATILYGFLSVALILAGLCGINLGFGVRSADLNWTDPRRMASGASGCLATIASVAYLFAAVLLFFAPPIGLPLLKISEGIGQLIGLLIGGTLALLCTILPLAMVKDWVYRIGEE
jgi:ABC-2 type transport system permease protein